MKWQSIGFSIVFCLSSHMAWAQAIPFPRMFSDVPIQRFNPTDNPRFNLIEREFNNLITRRGDPLVTNVFCASGFVFSDGDPLTTVIWTNREQLYWWQGAKSEDEREQSISLWLAPYSDLKNAVEDGTILGGPTMVNRSQAKAVVEDCERYGQKFLVRPFTPVEEKTDDDFDVEDLEYIED